MMVRRMVRLLMLGSLSGWLPLDCVPVGGGM